MSHELICSCLKLATDKWPPDHYTLLGLEPGESDAKRIEKHVQERMENLRRYQLTHAEQVTEGMNCLAQALVCLTDPAAKKAYDAKLLPARRAGSAKPKSGTAAFRWSSLTGRASFSNSSLGTRGSSWLRIAWIVWLSVGVIGIAIAVPYFPVLKESLFAVTQEGGTSDDGEEPAGPLRRFEEHTGPVTCVAYSPDGQYALSGDADHGVLLWEVATGRERRRFEGLYREVLGVAFTAGARRALASSKDYPLRIWDLDSGQSRFRLEGKARDTVGVAFSFDGSRMLFSDGEQVRLWDVVKEREVRLLLPDRRGIISLAISRDGDQVLLGGKDSILQLWDLKSRREIQRFKGHSGPITGVAFSPDGRRLLSGSEDQSVRLWDAAKRKELRLCSGHTGPVTSVAFSPDGRRALTGSADKTMRLWDVESGQQVHCFTGHMGSVTSVAFSPDGYRALSASADKTIQLWRLPK